MLLLSNEEHICGRFDERAVLVYSCVYWVVSVEQVGIPTAVGVILPGGDRVVAMATRASRKEREPSAASPV